MSWSFFGNQAVFAGENNWYGNPNGVVYRSKAEDIIIKPSPGKNMIELHRSSWGGFGRGIEIRYQNLKSEFRNPFVFRVSIFDFRFSFFDFRSSIFGPPPPVISKFLLYLNMPFTANRGRIKSIVRMSLYCWVKTIVVVNKLYAS